MQTTNGCKYVGVPEIIEQLELTSTCILEKHI